MDKRKQITCDDVRRNCRVIQPKRSALHRMGFLLMLAFVCIFAIINAGTAAAQYSPTTPAVESLFDYAAMAVGWLTTAGLMWSVIGGVLLTVGLGLTALRKLGARSR